MSSGGSRPGRVRSVARSDWDGTILMTDEEYELSGGWYYLPNSGTDYPQPPRDGTVIEGWYKNGTKRLTRWVKTPDYEGWDTGAMITPIEWRPYRATN